MNPIRCSKTKEVLRFIVSTRESLTMELIGSMRPGIGSINQLTESKTDHMKKNIP